MDTLAPIAARRELTLARESGGTAHACLDMAQATAERGHEVAIFATDYGGGLGSPPPAGVELREFPVGWPTAWRTSLGLIQALWREIDRFDVMHVHSLYLFHTWVGGDSARFFGLPYIISPHGSLDPYIWRRSRLRKAATELVFQRRVLANAAAIHYTSAVERDISAPVAGPAPARVVPLGIDLAAYDALPGPAPFHAAFPITRGRRLVLFMGRLHEKKGLDLLVDGFAAAHRVHPDLHLVVAGPDDGAGEPAKRQLARLGLTEHATFTGMLLGEAKFSALSAASMFVLPSHSENFGIVVAEAMAAGLPTVVSDKVNIHNEIGGRGAIVVPCQAEAVGEAMLKLAGDPAEARRIGVQARETVRTLYAWTAVAERLEALYRDVAR